MEKITYRAIQTVEISSGACAIAALKPSTAFNPFREACGVTFRRAVIEDSPSLLKMHQRLSRESIYYRYLRHYIPGLKGMEEICRQPPERGGAIVAALPDCGKSIVGLAYYIREADRGNHIAEFGIAVEDGFQGISLGRALFDNVCNQARLNGMHQLEAYVYPQNERMLGLLKRCPLPVKAVRSADHIEVTVDLSGRTISASMFR